MLYLLERGYLELNYLAEEDVWLIPGEQERFYSCQTSGHYHRLSNGERKFRLHRHVRTCVSVSPRHEKADTVSVFISADKAFSDWTKTQKIIDGYDAIFYDVIVHI